MRTLAWCGVRHPKFKWACAKAPGHIGPHLYEFVWWDVA